MSATTTTRLHHPFSPSKLQYLEASPYWESEDGPITEASERGTAQHDAAEESIDIDDPSLRDREAEAVAMCKDYRDRIIAKYPGGTVVKEQYLPIDSATITDAKGNKFQGTTGGYLDFGVISACGTIGELADWKFGLWSVEDAESNLQGIAYLLGLWFRFPKLQQFTVHFFMPHRGELTFHTFKRSEFEGLLLRVKTVVARAIEARRNKERARCSPTIATCLFCANKGDCPALTAFALKVGKKYAPLKIPEQITPSLIADPAQAKTAMEVAQLLEAWSKAVRRQITERAIDSEKWIPEGYRLRSRQDSEVISWRRLVVLARRFGVSDAVLKSAVSFNRTALNKAVRDNMPRGEKEAAEEKFREELLKRRAIAEEQPVTFLERLKT